MRKFIIIVSLCLYSSFYTNGVLWAQLIDDNTPTDARPYLNNATSDEWQLNFSDEFNASSVDLLKWDILESNKSRAPRPKLGIDDWWWKKENVWQQDGNLVLRVDKHDANTMHCGSVNTNNLYETQYGYFEVRMKIADASKGTHTAFWFQGDNMGNVDNTANDGAEIDVFESAWLDDYTKSVVHIDGYGADHQANTKKYLTPDIHDGNYHIWGLHWTENYMDIYYDGVFKVRYSDAKWIVKSLEYLWLSNGASFGIEGDYFTRQAIGTLTHAYVDYIRVWKSANYDAQNELECEDLNPSSPTGNGIQIVNNNAASEGQHVKFEAQSAGNEIVFEVPIEQNGYHQFALQSLTWTSFGQYKCSIETGLDHWQQLENTIDMYSINSSLIQQAFSELYLDAGTCKVKFTCTGKNASSGGFVGSFDKLLIKSRYTQPTSLREDKPKKLRFYPNPFDEQLNVSGLEIPTEIEVYNMLGVLVKKQLCLQQIDLAGLEKGFYLIEVNNEMYKVKKQ